MLSWTCILVQRCWSRIVILFRDLRKSTKILLNFIKTAIWNSKIRPSCANCWFLNDNNSIIIYFLNLMKWTQNIWDCHNFGYGISFFQFLQSDRVWSVKPRWLRHCVEFAQQRIGNTDCLIEKKKTFLNFSKFLYRSWEN